jgi:hypothetical protein
MCKYGFYDIYVYYIEFIIYRLLIRGALRLPAVGSGRVYTAVRRDAAAPSGAGRELVATHT